MALGEDTDQTMEWWRNGGAKIERWRRGKSVKVDNSKWLKLKPLS
ncbi:hypothetical protein CCACVL1_12607 [Corchorus capsularis]|uniref:Uncharacterized protein n=1 Tax=Corchorus capsularis TaxID=210143 RepID=A0A1R3IEU8_COCAP|nr:hypothetical protein CCACVL1_12607 [Corchorus capsularis]